MIKKKLDKTATKYRWVAFATLLIAAFMQLLDVTIVNVAIPTLRTDLNMSYAAIQWMAAGYTLSFATFLVAGGRLGDIFGRKKIFIIGITWFTIASLLCGIAQTGDQLVISRLIQGVGAAMMMPQIMANLVVLFKSGKERLKASGLYGAVAGLATVSGPIIGGLLIESNVLNLDWRSIFLINIPVGIFALIVSLKVLPESKSPHPLKVDWLGMLLLGTALVMLLYPLIQGRELGWPAWSIWLMIGSLPLLVVFWFWERYKERKDQSPLVLLELFKSKVFVSGVILFILFFGVMVSFFFIFTLFLQAGLGYSALHAGLNNVPLSVGLAISAGVLVNILLPKIGRNILVLGVISMATGFWALIVALNWFGADISSWNMLPGLMFIGLGMGLFIASLFNFVLAGIRHYQAGSASGVLSTVQEIGAATGIALMGVIFFNILGANAPTAAQTQGNMIHSQLTVAQVPPEAQTAIIQSFEDCFVDLSNAKDPNEEPASCQQAGEQLPPQLAATIQTTLTSAGKKANTENFIETFRTTLLVLVAVCIGVFALIPLLPKKAPETLPEEAFEL